jgi:hypothetical protein
MLGNYKVVGEYRGTNSRWADDHFCALVGKGMAIPTLPQVAEICVKGKISQNDAEFISSTVRLDYNDNGHKLDVYVHVPLQCDAKSFDQKYHAFHHPFPNSANVKKLLEGAVKDKHGNQVVFVVDGKNEAGLWKKRQEAIKSDGKWHDFREIYFNSVEDAVKFPSVVAVFGGEENFARYAQHYGIENVKLFYSALLSMGKGNTDSHFLCLRDGNPEPYRHSYSAFNRIEMKEDIEPEFDFCDFVIGEPGKMTIRI